MINRPIKALVLAAAAVSAGVFIGGAAYAADLGPRPIYKAPAFAPAPFTWTGFYVGLNGGGGSAHFSRTGLYDSNPVDDSESQTGYFAGGQIGYNYQFSPNFVVGVEADFQGSNFNNSFSCGAGIYAPTGTCYDDSSYAGYDLRDFGTVRGRLGYAFTNWLAYVTGGFAWGDVRYTANDYLPDGVGTGSTTADGWTIGGGVEYAINNHWSVKAEYLHLDLGSVTIDPIPGQNPNYVVDVKTTADIGRFGVNYKF